MNNLYNIFTSLAYLVRSKAEYNQKLENIPAGWEVIAKTAGTWSERQYKAIAFVNEQEKKIVFASAGTKIFDAYDLYDDLLLATGRVPTKFSDIQKFIDEVAEEKPDIADYEISTAGHSLGSVLSDLTALELQSRGFDVKSSHTIDSPGSAPVIKTAMKQEIFTDTAKVDVEAINFEIKNADPNLINTTNKHIGNVEMTVFKPEAMKFQKSTWLKDIYLGYVTKYKGLQSIAFDFFAEISGLNWFEQKIDDLKRHDLAGFRDLQTVEVEDWSIRKTVLKYDEELYDYISKIDSVGPKDYYMIREIELESEVIDIQTQIFSMNDMAGYFYDDITPVQQEELNSSVLGVSYWDAISGLTGFLV